MQFNRLFDELDEIVLRVDRSGRLYYINSKGRRSFNQTEQPEHLDALLKPAAVKKLLKILDSTTAGTTVSSEIEFSEECMRPGINRYYTAVAVADGVITQGPSVTVLLRDRPVETAGKVLPDEMFREAFEHSTEGLGITDSEGRFVYVNPAFCRMCGYEAHELIGRDGSLLSEGTDSESLIMTEIVESMNKTGRWMGEAQVKKKNGTIIDTYTCLYLIEHKEYGTFWAGLQRDITEERKMVRDLAENVRKAEAANEAKSHFLSVMNHELRTPLNAILGSVQVFSRDGLNSEQVQMLNTINNAGTHLLHLVSDILNLNKIESGNYRLNYVKFDILELIRQIAEIYRINTGGKPVEIIEEIAPDIPVHFHGDPVALRQIVFNLVSNAVKFTKEGEIRIRAGWHEKPGGLLKIEVSDTGYGIAEDHLTAIFERFRQVESDIQREHEGTGIGLNIVKEFTELMQGEVSVESQQGRGSTFTCLLSIDACPTWLKEKPVEHACSLCERAVLNSGDDISYSAYRCLVIEDNLINLQVLVKMLEKLGVEKIDKAENGEKAIEYLKDNNFNYDFIFLDLHLPDMDGFEISANIKPTGAQERFRKPYIIAVSADTLEENIDRFFKHGVIDYLPKPVNADKLQKKLKKICRLSEEELSKNYNNTLSAGIFPENT